MEMQNGCICCTLREDLLVEVKRLAQENRFDYLLIESTGISEPMQVAETFTFADETGASLSQFARLGKSSHNHTTTRSCLAYPILFYPTDTMVTMVDARNVLKNFKSLDRLVDRGEALDESDFRNIVDLLTDQIG